MSTRRTFAKAINNSFLPEKNRILNFSVEYKFSLTKFLVSYFSLFNSLIEKECLKKKFSQLSVDRIHEFFLQCNLIQ